MIVSPCQIAATKLVCVEQIRKELCAERTRNSVLLAHLFQRSPWFAKSHGHLLIRWSQGDITEMEAANLEGIEEVITVHASVGDWIIVRSRHVGGAERRGEIVGVRGDGGAPPWDVRWTGEEHEALFFPGADATIDPRPTHPA